MRTKTKCSLLSILLIAVMVVALGLTAYAVQSNPVSQDGLTAQMFTDKNSYKAGESIDVTLRVDNQTGKEVTIWTSVTVPESVKLSGSASYEAFLQDGGTWITPDADAQTNDNIALGGAVATGDDTKMGLMLVLSALAVCGIAALLVYGRKRRQLLSIVLCLVMIGGLVAPAVQVQAADLTGEIALSCIIQVDGKDEAVSATISYTIYGGGEDAEEEFTTPSEEPSETPSEEPSETPSETPSEQPSETPSEEPSETPSEESSETPSETPSEQPSETPSETPSEQPSEEPSETPSETPSEQPSETPSETPSEQPSEEPSETPSEEPSEQPSEEPSEEPNYDIITTTELNSYLKQYHLTLDLLRDGGEAKGGEGGQVVETIEVSPFDSNIVMMGTDTTGAFRSEDGGANWESVTEGLNMWVVGDIAFDPTEEGVVYLYGSDGSDKTQWTRMSKHELSGIYKSVDNGKSFELVLNCNSLVSLTADELIGFDSQGNVYVLATEALYVSKDDGASWQIIKEFEGNNPSANELNVVYDLYVSEDASVIITTNRINGMMKTVDGGANWTCISPEGTTTALGFDIDPEDPNHILATFNGDNKGVHESHDLGQTWTLMEGVAPIVSSGSSVLPSMIWFGENENGGTRLFLEFNNMHDHYYYSDDNGVTWQQPEFVNAEYGICYEAVGSGYYAEGMTVDPNNPNVWYLSNGDAIFKSTDYGKTFKWSNGGYSGLYADDFYIDDAGKLWIASIDYGLYVTESSYLDGTYPVVKSLVKNHGLYTNNARSVSAIDINPRNQNEIMISLGSQSQQQLMRSTDGGETFSVVEGVEKNIGEYQIIKYHETNEDIIYTYRYISYDGGETWTRTKVGGNAIVIRDVSSVNNDVVWGSKGGNIYYSSDCGRTFTLVATVPSSMKTIMADANDVNSAFVGTTGETDHAYKITYANGEATLETITEFDHMQINCFAQDPENSQHIIAAGQPKLHIKSEGFYESYDGGETWTLVTGLPGSGVVFTAEFIPGRKEVLLSGFTGGIVAYDYEEFQDVN